MCGRCQMPTDFEAQMARARLLRDQGYSERRITTEAQDARDFYPGGPCTLDS
jgi:hypothetical protein